MLPFTIYDTRFAFVQAFLSFGTHFEFAKIRAIRVNSAPFSAKIILATNNFAGSFTGSF